MTLADYIARGRDFLRSRSLSYQLTFPPDHRDAQAVLKDLARFCRAHAPTAHPDPYMAARLDGRREVWLRIQQHLQLSEDQLWALYGAPNKGE